jgi:hypothetical protein
VAFARKRTSAAERRALREINQERALRQKAEQPVAETSADERARPQVERDTLSRQCVEAQRALADGGGAGQSSG